MDRGDLKRSLDRIDPVEIEEESDEKRDEDESSTLETIPEENHIITNEKGGMPFVPSKKIETSRKDKGKKECKENGRDHFTQKTVVDPGTSSQSQNNKRVEKKSVKIVSKWVPKAIVSNTATSESNSNNCSRVDINTAASSSSSSNSNTLKVNTVAYPEKRKHIIVTKYSSQEIPNKDYLLKLNRLSEGNQGRRRSHWHVDSGCSRHVTGIMSLLEDFKKFDGGHVAFGDNPKGGKISGKGFKIDESQVMLRTPRKDNVYCLDIEDASSVSSLNCLFSKASILRTKDETSGLIKPFVIRMENNTNLKVKIIRSDNGTEFRNADLNSFCKEKGIERQYSAPRTPQQNGVAERRNRTLIEAARTMCPYTILDTKTHFGKFESKSDDGFLVGYSTQSKALRVFNSSTRIIEESDNVRCNENTPNLPASGPNWLFDIDSLTNSLNMSSAVITGSSTEKTQETSTPSAMFPMPTVDAIELCTSEDRETDQEKKADLAERNIEKQIEENSPTDNTVLSPISEVEPMEPQGSSSSATGPDLNDSNLGVNLPEEPLHLTRTQKNHPPSLVIGDMQSPMITRK
ncbi:hypothetical protein OSB04_019570 [Centaurea solstitialis]|uniref:Integrase catalytic domain-containing protein n=1 Tax=Centaurea solstitialis TaxID=347529 RepID=A0AA38W317_9ASTR|nr:hypothetical protein OSB04_019570 [Centaurea solstitialis]